MVRVADEMEWDKKNKFALQSCVQNLLKILHFYLSIFLIWFDLFMGLQNFFLITWDDSNMVLKLLKNQQIYKHIQLHNRNL